MARPEQFARRLFLHADRLGVNASKLVRQVGLVADQALVLATPVDKGIARSNWQVSVTRPIRKVIPAYAPGDKLGLGERRNAAKALTQGAAAIAKYKSENQKIYITNNVHYITLLNGGSSRQAPAAFVQIAVNQAVDAVRRSHLLRKSGP